MSCVRSPYPSRATPLKYTKEVNKYPHTCFNILWVGGTLSLRAHANRWHLYLCLWKVSASSHSLALRYDTIKWLRHSPFAPRKNSVPWSDFCGLKVYQELKYIEDFQHNMRAVLNHGERMYREIAARSDKREERGKSRTPIHIHYWRQLFLKSSYPQQFLTFRLSDWKVYTYFTSYEYYMSRPMSLYSKENKIRCKVGAVEMFLCLLLNYAVRIENTMVHECGALVKWTLVRDMEMFWDHPPQCNLAHPKSHMMCPGIEVGPLQWELRDEPPEMVLFPA
jgi:hypothetical protein